MLGAQAWSNIVHTLIPNANVLSRHLNVFANACSATEVILFERTTFLVIATSSQANSEGHDHEAEAMYTKRYERTSELIKYFKHSCTRSREEFRSLEMELFDFTAVLDEMTRNTYVMVVVHDPGIGTHDAFRAVRFYLLMDWIFAEIAALKMNVKLARRKFEELQNDSLGT